MLYWWIYLIIKTLNIHSIIWIRKLGKIFLISELRVLEEKYSNYSGINNIKI